MAHLTEDEKTSYAREGWVVPHWRLPGWERPRGLPAVFQGLQPAGGLRVLGRGRTAGGCSPSISSSIFR